MYLGYVHYRIVGAPVIGAAFVLPSFLVVLAIGWAYVRYGGERAFLTWCPSWTRIKSPWGSLRNFSDMIHCSRRQRTFAFVVGYSATQWYAKRSRHIRTQFLLIVVVDVRC